MGKIKNNVVTRGFSGKFGEDLVFRQVDNRTIFAKRTVSTQPPTARQVEVQSRFTEASLFASAAIDNQQAFTDYQLMAKQQGLKSAYVAALMDFLTYPEIGSIFTAAYTGTIGDVINIKPKITHKVIGIDVKIVSADGAEIESGAATLNGLKWHYVATKANANVKGSKFVLVARDRQKKKTTFEQVIA